MKLLIIGACALIICIFAAGCISPEVPVNIEDPVLTVTVQKEGMMIPVNASMTYILPSNPITGYGWTVLGSEGLIVKDEYKATPVPEGWAGGGGCQYYTITAEKAGSYTFKAGYERPWETDVDPIYTTTQTLVFSEAEGDDPAGDVMLTVLKDDYITDTTTGLVGAGGTYVWYVTAEKAGTYQFGATNQRSGQDPANLFFFDLTFV